MSWWAKNSSTTPGSDPAQQPPASSGLPLPSAEDLTQAQRRAAQRDGAWWLTVVGAQVALGCAFVAYVNKRPGALLPLPGMLLGLAYAHDVSTGVKDIRIQRTINQMTTGDRLIAAPLPAAVFGLETPYSAFGVKKP